MQSTIRNFATEPEPGLARLAETIAGRMFIAQAFELATDAALAERNDSNGDRWKTDLACRAMLADLQRAGWTGQKLDELFFAVLPEHPSHLTLLKLLAELPKGAQLKAQIEKGYVASFLYNFRGAVPIRAAH